MQYPTRNSANMIINFLTNTNPRTFLLSRTKTEKFHAPALRGKTQFYHFVYSSVYDFIHFSSEAEVVIVNSSDL